ncbi:MAG: helix-turn-helix transcriptional regulator, partial [Oscillospiraceae bacterium]|nr:helix-turn-helix transcriptional regulator [Oscillospiraceae bacterium]
MISKRIKELRLSKGYNMRQMATALNLPYTTYVNYEKGAREPSSEQILLIAKYFDVTTDFIMGRTENNIHTEPSNIGIIEPPENIKMIP